MLHSHDVSSTELAMPMGMETPQPTVYLLCTYGTVLGEPESFVALHVLTVPLSRVLSMANAKRVFLNAAKPETC